MTRIHAALEAYRNCYDAWWLNMRLAQAWNWKKDKRKESEILEKEKLVEARGRMSLARSEWLRSQGFNQPKGRKRFQSRAQRAEKELAKAAEETRVKDREAEALVAARVSRAVVMLSGAAGRIGIAGVWPFVMMAQMRYGLLCGKGKGPIDLSENESGESPLVWACRQRGARSAMEPR